MVELVKMRPKLIAAAAMLIIALVLLVATSLAWFTISTNPEISGFNVNLYSARTVLLSLDNETYTEALDLSEKFNKLAPLKPVSTVDGLNWFLPTYDNITGELLMTVTVATKGPTCPTFGGENLDKLFITTGGFGREQYPQAGDVFVAETGVKGMKAFRFHKI